MGTVSGLRPRFFVCEVVLLSDSLSPDRICVLPEVSVFVNLRGPRSAGRALLTSSQQNARPHENLFR